MSAKGPWFYCGKCGFKNHPRINGQKVKDLLDDDVDACEQCGAARTDENAHDYDPGA